MPKLQPKTIGVIGSRRRDTDEDFRLVLAKFNEIYVKGDRLVSGGCKQGGDRFAEVIAKSKGITITIHYPRKENLRTDVPSKVAWALINYERNTWVADNSDVCIACCALDRTGGTEDTVKKLQARGKTIYFV